MTARTPRHIQRAELRLVGVGADEDREAIQRLLRRKGIKNTKPRRTAEWDEQERFVTALTPLTIAPARFWFVPNGGNLSRAQAGKFKAMGLTAGVSDLHFAWAMANPEAVGRGGVCLTIPCFGVIEMKRPGAPPSETKPEQQAFMDDMAALGHRRAVCHTTEEGLATLDGWGFPLRPWRLV